MIGIIIAFALGFTTGLVALTCYLLRDEQLQSLPVKQTLARLVAARISLSTIPKPERLGRSIVRLAEEVADQNQRIRLLEAQVSRHLLMGLNGEKTDPMTALRKVVG